MTDFPSYYEQLKTLMGELGADIPDTMNGFKSLHQGSLLEGSLDTKQKELIALGIAISVRCNGCIAFHVSAALDAGATRQEITETIGVSILMGGGPSMIYGLEALEAVKQFSATSEVA
jgi:AhpD family alkylhydroperoxidase